VLSVLSTPGKPDRPSSSRDDRDKKIRIVLAAGMDYMLAFVYG
jgi:hypothetical protein